jgi:DNA invertase Pin-like site-specific DNA recombinase
MLNHPPPPLALLYRRVSTGKQENSLDLQEQRLDDYARYRQFTPHHIEDEAVSGSVPMLDRPGARRMLRALRDGIDGVKPRAVVALKLDRLGRDVFDIIGFIRACWDAEVEVHLVDMNAIFTRNPFNEFTLTMMAAAAQLERQLIQDRVQRNADAAFAAHKMVSGTVSFGYRAVDAQGNEAVPVADATGRKRWPADTRIAEHPAEMIWLRQMHTWRSQSLSLKAIARMLNQAGVPTKTGSAPWQAGNVAKVLQSRHARHALTVPTTPMPTPQPQLLAA